MSITLAQRRPRWIWFVVENSLLLLIGAIAALFWINVHPGSYHAIAEPLRFAVNDIGMVFFFGIAAKAVFEATLPGGSLSSPRTSTLPILAAVGGMAGPAAIYITQVHWLGVPELSSGWAIPCATDIAFSYLVARLVFGTSHPIVPFLLMLAIVDDALGLVILAIFYPSGPVHFLECILLVGAGMLVAWMLQRRHVASFWPYVLLGGGLSWLGLLRGGLHPALALVPIVGLMPYVSRDVRDHSARASQHSDTLGDFERWWKLPVEAVLLLFGLVNAGVSFRAVGVGTWLVVSAIVLGKPIGIVMSVVVGRVVSLEMSASVTWRDVVTVGVIASIGFTVALFFATAAFKPGPLLDQTKMGALLSLGASVLGIGVAAVLRVGRFAPRAAARSQAIER
jgi:NhaA family Na+:H+ antiporter